MNNNAEETAGRSGSLSPHDLGLLLVFFASGVAALTYQVAWQRLLYGALGIDLTSITLVIAAFMLGLGCGALLGGYLADRYLDRIIFLFGGIELAIGLFGVASPFLIALIGDWFVHASRPVVFLGDFLLLLFPTTAMGATLPMLVAHMHRKSRNVGISIGQLYLSNTLGAAFGAAITSFAAFHVMTLNQSIWAAALINAAVAASAFTWLRSPK